MLSYGCGHVPFPGSPSQPQLAHVQGTGSVGRHLWAVSTWLVLSAAVQNAWEGVIRASLEHGSPGKHQCHREPRNCSLFVHGCVCLLWHTRSCTMAHHILLAEPLSSAPLPEVLQMFGDASGHWRFLLPSFLRWLSSDLCTRKHSFKFWARILGFRISSPIELGNQPLSWS